MTTETGAGDGRKAGERHTISAADEMHTPRRIVLHGVTGSGKTTAARRIGQLTGLPVVDGDSMLWEPGWKGVPRDDQWPRSANLSVRPSGCWTRLVRRTWSVMLPSSCCCSIMSDGLVSAAPQTQHFEGDPVHGGLQWKLRDLEQALQP